MKKLVLALPLLLLLPLSIIAQTIDCVHFEDSTFYINNITPNQTDFGAVFYENSAITFRYKYENHASTGIGDLGFVDAITSTWIDYNPNFVGNVLSMGEVTVQADFSSLNYFNKTLSFDTSIRGIPDGVNPYNVNGAGYDNLPNGINYTFTELANGLQVQISGPIQTIELWGFEVAYDNLCVLPLAQACLDFNQLSNGSPSTIYGASTGFSPGDLIGNLNGVDLRLQEQECSGQSNFQDLYISPNFLYTAIVNAIDLEFDLSPLNEAVNEISFEIQAGSSNCPTIRINGGDLILIDPSQPLDLSALGIEVRQTTITTNNTSIHQYTLFGPVFERLAIGGIDMPIVDFCFQRSTANCQIALQATTGPCNSQNFPYYVRVEAEYVNTSDSFYLQTNAIDFGKFAYSDLPIYLGPFQPGQNIDSLILLDAENFSCIAAAEVVELPCPCSIEIVETAVLECFQGSYYLFVRYSYENPFSEMHIYLDGNFYQGNIFQSGTIAIGPLDADDEFFDKCLEGAAMFALNQ
ncbi:MAG: hypothetical protein AAFP19_08955, partial [Bacteroidota bacterium]